MIWITVSTGSLAKVYKYVTYNIGKDNLKIIIIRLITIAIVIIKIIAIVRIKSIARVVAIW